MSSDSDPGCRAQRVAQPCGDADRPQRERQQHRRLRRPAQQVKHPLECSLVGPVEVVEQQRDRLLLGDQLKQRPECAVVAEPFGRPGRGPRDGAGLRRTGQDRGEIGNAIWAERLQSGGAEPRHPIIERVDDEAERDIHLVLGGATGEEIEPGGSCPVLDVREQRGLPDPGLAEQREHGAVAVSRSLHRRRSNPLLGRAPNQSPGCHTGEVRGRRGKSPMRVPSPSTDRSPCHIDLNERREHGKTR